MLFVVFCLCVLVGMVVFEVIVEVYIVVGLFFFMLVGLFDIEVKEVCDCVCVVI